MRSATDNAFYLTHTVEGEPGSEGAIYTEDYNDMDIDADDRIITLSTCYGSQSDRRFLVQTVLVFIENTK